MRHGTKIIVDQATKEILEGIVNSRTERHCLVERAKIILLAEAGQETQAIAKTMSIAPSTVSKWRTRWPIAMAQKHKTPRAAVEFALQDNQRPGQPTKYTAEMKCQMFKMACEKPEDHGVPITQWTLSELQERLREEKGINVSRSRLCIFLKESGHSSA